MLSAEYQSDGFQELYLKTICVLMFRARREKNSTAVLVGSDSREFRLSLDCEKIQPGSKYWTGSSYREYMFISHNQKQLVKLMQRCSHQEGSFGLPFSSERTWLWHRPNPTPPILFGRGLFCILTSPNTTGVWRNCHRRTSWQWTPP